MPVPKGFKHSKESKIKMSGKNHPRWKNGISKMKYYDRNYLRNLRSAVLETMGGKCIRCGFDDKRALQIDHINGGGQKDRKENGRGKLYKIVMESFLRKENKYQLLCANCNWIKKFENNENKKSKII